MNKCIRQNWKIWNNIQFHPLGKLQEEVPQDKKKASFWAESTWKRIVLKDMERHVIYQRKDKGTNKYTITVWDDGKYCYLIQVLRTEYNTDSTVIYMKEYSESNVKDFLAIAKFIHRDINKIVGKSKEDVKQFNELVNKQELEKLSKELKADA